jgi:hypothetical protein
LNKADFLKYYTTLSTVELLKIFEEKENYQAVAIEAAKEILSKRNYSSEELNTARAEINSLLDKKRGQQEKISQAKNKANDFIDENFGVKEKSPDKMLNLFCAALFVYSIITGFFNIKKLAYYFDSRNEGYAAGLLFWLLQLFIIYLLYKRNSWGWVLTVMGYIILASQNIQSFIFNLSYPDSLFYIRRDPYTPLFGFIVCVGAAIFLNRKRIFALFPIENRGRVSTFITSLVISLFLIFIF